MTHDAVQNVHTTVLRWRITMQRSDADSKMMRGDGKTTNDETLKCVKTDLDTSLLKVPRSHGWHTAYTYGGSQSAVMCTPGWMHRDGTPPTCMGVTGYGEVHATCRMSLVYIPGEQSMGADDPGCRGSSPGDSTTMNRGPRERRQGS